MDKWPGKTEWWKSLLRNRINKKEWKEMRTVSEISGRTLNAPNSHYRGPRRKETEPENIFVEKWKWSHSVVSDSLRPMDCSPPSSSIHGILQARILEWIAISFSRGSSQPRDQTQVSHIAGRCFNLWATRECCIFVELRAKNFPNRRKETFKSREFRESHTG